MTQEPRRNPNKISVVELRDFAIRHQLPVIGSSRDGVAVKKDFIVAYNEYYRKLCESVTIRQNSDQVLCTPERLIKIYNVEMVYFWKKQKNNLQKILFSARTHQVSSETTAFILNQCSEVQKYSIEYQFDITELLQLLQEFKAHNVETRIDDSIL